MSKQGNRLKDTLTSSEKELRLLVEAIPVLIPGEAAHQNEVMSPAVTE